ncbi:MAG: hypothetical protein FWG83_01175 [Oscillospiraceae bacterium]|nr:hypothetical protein [Oscillospiraceae bacterium]
MKKTENILREILRPILVTLIIFAAGGMVLLYQGMSSKTVADRADLSQYATFDVYPESAGRAGNFYVNSKGMTVGSCSDAATLAELPDLIAVLVIEGQTGSIHGRTPEGWISGFVVAKDFYADDIDFRPTSPEEAVRISEERQKRGPRSIPVYDFEKEVVIGTVDVW